MDIGIGGCMEHLTIEIKGKFTKYAEITAEQGYCFYDVDEEERQYTGKMFTPITDESEIARKYAVVQGSAEKLNEELEQQGVTEINVQITAE